MPTIEENCSFFDETYDWPQAGEEWSKDWGSAHMQWYGCILPRISAFVPTDTILEVAPGYGRWRYPMARAKHDSRENGNVRRRIQPAVR